MFQNCSTDEDDTKTTTNKTNKTNRYYKINIITNISIRTRTAVGVGHSGAAPVAQPGALQPLPSVQLDDGTGVRGRRPISQLLTRLALQQAILRLGDHLLLGRHLGHLHSDTTKCKCR